MSIGFLILRLVVGLTLAAHGAQKLSGLSQTAAAFEQLGFVPGRRSALLAGLAETGAGLLLALGLFTPGAAAIAVAVMVVAAVSALSLDAVLGIRDAGAGWGLAALVFGLAGATVQLARRQVAAAQKVQ